MDDGADTRFRTRAENGTVDRGYNDFQENLALLERAGMVRVIDKPVNKDTELHPPGPLAISRWHARGGPESMGVHQRHGFARQAL